MTDDITRLADKIAIYADDSIDASRLGRLAHHWEAELRALAAQGKAGGVQIIGWIYEDRLPAGYPYDAMFPHSKVDGVRLFPVFAPANPPEAGVTDAVSQKSRQLIVGFMLDCNAIGMTGAAENLGKAIKEYAAHAPQPKDAT